jgi:2-isopropylmalate synthase
MMQNPDSKYRPFHSLQLNCRIAEWPNRRLTQHRAGCRQICAMAIRRLPTRWTAKKKMRFYRMLLEIGFKEIEVAFPSASQTEFNFVRRLIEDNLIPDDVTIQVLTQSRADLIARTFESLRGARQAIVHLYNATAPLFRRVVFKMEKDEIIDLAVSGVTAMLEESRKQPETRWTFEYSPETFCFTEPDFAAGNLRTCSGCLAANARKQGDPEPPCYGRSGNAECLCGSDRMVLPQPVAP